MEKEITDIRTLNEIRCKIYGNYVRLPYHSWNESTYLEIEVPLNEFDMGNLLDALKNYINALVICNPDKLNGVSCIVNESELMYLELLNLSDDALKFLVGCLNGMNINFCGIPVTVRISDEAIDHCEG